MSLILDARYSMLKSILLTLLIYGLWTMDYGLVYAQEKVKVEGNLEIKSTATNDRNGLILRPLTSEPANPAEGTIYYDSIGKKHYYYNHLGQRKDLAQGGEDYTIAPRIVAAYNSVGSSCGAEGCSNTKADKTCDGTDDQVTINEAINELRQSGAARFGAVYLLEGDYSISASINLPRGTSLIGTGAKTVLHVATGVSNLNVINAKPHTFISQLKISGDNIGANNNGIYFSYNYDPMFDKGATVKHVWIEIINGNGIKVAMPEAIISENFFTSNSTAICIDGSGEDTEYKSLIARNILNTNGTGIHINLSYANTVLENRIRSSTLYGIYLYGGSENIISGNIASASASHGILLYYNSDFNLISGNNLINNGSSTTEFPTGVIPSDITIASSNYNSVTDNLISTNKHHGIFLKTTGNNCVNANLYSAGADIGYDGIKLDGATDNLISTNRLHGLTSGNGIYVDGNVNNLDNNSIIGFSKAINNYIGNTKFTDTRRITLEPKQTLLVSNGGTITPNFPVTYVPLQGAGGAVEVNSIAAGKVDGDMLILVGTSSSNTVKIKNPLNVKFSGGVTERTIGLEDVLTLMWHQVRWVELRWSDN